MADVRQRLRQDDWCARLVTRPQRCSAGVPARLASSWKEQPRRAEAVMGPREGGVARVIGCGAQSSRERLCGGGAGLGDVVRAAGGGGCSELG